MDDSFPTRLRRLREAREMSLPELAQETGLSKQGVYNLERDDADPQLSTIEKVAMALNVSPVALIPAKDNPLPEIESTTVDDDGEERRRSPTAAEKAAARAKREARDRRIDARFMREFEFGIEIDGRRWPELLRRPGESDAAWAGRLSHMNAEVFGVNVGQRVGEFCKKHGFRSPVEYVPPPPAPPTPRAAYSGDPALEDFARACEPYLRAALKSVDVSSARWCHTTLLDEMLALDEMVLRPALGKSSKVDTMVKKMAPLVRTMASDVWPKRHPSGCTPNPKGERDPRSEYVPRLKEVFATLGLAPSGMTLEENVDHYRTTNKAKAKSRHWQAHREMKPAERRKRLAEA
jgi:transcriptional regulator with XRE-family HTH domain